MSRFLFILLLCLPACVHAQVIEPVLKHEDSVQTYTPLKNVSEYVTIREITIAGNDITRRKIILRELSVQEGQIIRSDSIPELLNENKLRLANLALFNDIDLEVEKVSTTEISWHIHVKERWFILPQVNLQLADRNFNVWWVEQHHDINRINLGITAVDKNFRGNLETLAATVQVGYTQKLGLSYMIPYIDKAQKNGIGFSFSFARSQQTYYTTDSNKLLFVGNYGGQTMLKQFDGTFSYVYRPAYAIRHLLQLSYRDYSVADTVIKLNHDYFSNGSNTLKLIELSYRFEYNHVDNWSYPLIGFKLVASATARSGIEGMNFQAFSNMEAGIFRNLAPKWYVSAIFRGRLMLPEDLPYSLLGGLGIQSNYVRGYEYYIINGTHYGLLRFDLKREIFNNTYKNIPLKYLTSIPIRIYPKVFADLGYIKEDDPGNSFLGNRFLCSVGAGIDVVTLYDFKIRVEFAYNYLKQNGLYLHTNSE